MAQLLRTLVALAEVLSSVPNTHIITRCNPSSKGTSPLLDSVDTCTYTYNVHTDSHTHMYTNTNKKF